MTLATRRPRSAATDGASQLRARLPAAKALNRLVGQQPEHAHHDGRHASTAGAWSATSKTRATSPAAQTGDGAGNGKVDPTAAALGEGAAIHCSYGSRCHAQSRDEAAGIPDKLTLLALFRAGAVLRRG